MPPNVAQGGTAAFTITHLGLTLGKMRTALTVDRAFDILRDQRRKFGFVVAASSGHARRTRTFRTKIVSRALIDSSLSGDRLGGQQMLQGGCEFSCAHAPVCP